MNRIETKPRARSSARPLWSSWFALLALASVARAQFYAVTDLGTLGGTNAMAYSLNNHEQIVGAAQTSMGTYHGFMFDGGRMVDLGTMGGSNSWAYGINDMGWMVGAAEMPMTNMHAFLCTNGLVNPTMMDMGTLGGTNSAAWMINMHGDMVGWAELPNGTHHAFFMTNSLMAEMVDMGTAGGTNSEAYCINSNRMVAGYAMMPNGMRQPIMSTNPMLGSSSMMGMGMGGMGASGGQMWSIDNLGNMAGMAQLPGGNHHAVVSGGGGMMGGRMNVDLGTLGGTNSIAYCLTDAGTVVGTGQLTNGMMHAFMVTNAMGGTIRMMDLNDMIPTNSGWELMEARGMNSAGQIIGWGMHAGHTNAFLLTPVSGPTMMASAPESHIAGPGAMVTLRMQMNAQEPLSYQWLRDGTPIPGATNSTCTLPGMSTNGVGRYTCVVRNSVGTVGLASAMAAMFSVHTTDGTPELMVAAPQGSRFRIDRSEHLGPAANWQMMSNLTVTGSMAQVRDPSAGESSARFYRAVMMP